MATEAEVLSTALNMVGQLRAANQRLIALENQVRQSPDVARAIGADVVQRRAEYSDLSSRFIQVYVLVTGGPAPDGLSLLPIAVIASAVVTLTAIAAALYAWNRLMDVLEPKAQAAKISAQNATAALSQIATLTKQAADADARGDTATANQIRTIIANLSNAASGGSGNQDMGQWFQDNWIFLAIAGTGMMVLPRLVGGR